MYYIYMIRCEDDSIYTGITNDISRRMLEHFSKDKKCAKYTKTHQAKKIEAVWQTENKVYAAKLEYWIKSLTKKEKEKLINDNTYLNNLFIDKIEHDKYISIKVSSVLY